MDKGQHSSPHTGEDFVYSTTKFDFFGQNSTILLHNGSGVKSLIAIYQFNEEWEVLWFLKEKLEELCPEIMKNRLYEAFSKIDDLEQYNPKPIWNRIDSFKENNCSLIFDLLEIPLVHGWLINDKNVEPKCYSEIDASVASDLENTMLNDGDVTESGLSSLKENLQDHQVCVFVHCEGFHTAIKHEDELYLLVVERKKNSRGMVWNKLNGSTVGMDLIEVREGNTSEEEDDIGLGQEQHSSGGSVEVSGSEEEDEVIEGLGLEQDSSGGSVEVSGSEEEQNGSEDSMETHAGRASPTTVLDGATSSSTSGSD